MAVDTNSLAYLIDPFWQGEGINGKPLVAGYMCVYIAGTDQKYITWQNWDGTRHPFKIPLGSDGRASILVEVQYTYDCYLYDSFGNLVCSRLNVKPVVGGDIVVSGITQVWHDESLSGDGTLQSPLTVVSAGKVYSGIEPIVVNNNEDKISAQHIPLGVQEPLYFVEDSESACIIGCSSQSEIPSAISGKWEEASNAVIENSAQWGIPEGTMNESAFTYDDSNNITAYNGSAFKAGDEFPESATEAINVVTANSAKWNSAYLPKGMSNYIGLYSLAQGLANSAEDYSLAQGGYNTAGGHSLAQGEYNSAEDHSLVQGIWNSARNSSIAQGDHTRAKNNSQAFGIGTIATNHGMAIGQHNLTQSAAFVIGNGTNDRYRSDAFVIDHSGNVSSQGDISASGVSLTSFYTDYQTNSANFITALPEDLVYTGDLNDYAKKDFVLSSINSSTSGLLPTSSFSSVSGSFLTALPSDLISSQSGTIFVSGYEIEGTNSAIATATVAGFATSFEQKTTGPSWTASFSWWKSVPNTIFTFTANWPNRDTIVTYSANTNLTGEIIAPRHTATKLDIAVPNATALNVWADDWFMMTDCVASASDSVGMTVGELAWASALPTYQYDSSNKISAINGSALANYELPTSVSAATDVVTANSANWNSTYNTVTANSADWSVSEEISGINGIKISEIADKVIIEVSADYYSASNPSGFITGVDLTPYQTTAGMTAYQPAGDYLTTADSANFLTAVPDTYLQNTDLTITDGKISEISGIPLSAGDELPSGILMESGLGYNAVQEISGINGSAIAQYGHEAQWLVHDDTLVHAANSAQYALGVNLSAVAQLLGVDETVLWTTANSVMIDNSTTLTAALSEPASNFKTLRVVCSNSYDQGETFKAPKRYWDIEVDDEATLYRFGIDLKTPNGDSSLYEDMCNCRYQNGIFSAFGGKRSNMTYTANSQNTNVTNRGPRIFEILGIGRRS